MNPNLTTENKMQLTLNDVKKIKKTFIVFELSNVLHNETYLKLAKNYPDRKVFDKSSANYPNRRFFNNVGDSQQTYDDFFASCVPEWNRLIDQLTSKQFVQKINHTIKIYEKFRFLGVFGLLLIRPWKRVDSLNDLRKLPLINKLLFQHYHVCIEFSEILTDGYISPHTDSARKLYSMMLYFPDENWSTQYGGGTCFFIPKNKVNLIASSQNRKKLIADDFLLGHESLFERNKIVGFMKNPYSWHGLKKIKCPNNFSRKALLITISIPKYSNKFKNIHDIVFNKITSIVWNIKY